MRFIKYILLFLFLSCTKQKKKLNTKELTVNDIEKDYKLLENSEILNLEKIIPLESSKNSLIGEINKIKVQDSLIYIMDKKITKQFLFSIQKESS